MEKLGFRFLLGKDFFSRCHMLSRYSKLSRSCRTLVHHHENFQRMDWIHNCRNARIIMFWKSQHHGFQVWNTCLFLGVPPNKCDQNDPGRHCHNLTVLLVPWVGLYLCSGRFWCRAWVRWGSGEDTKVKFRKVPVQKVPVQILGPDSGKFPEKYRKPVKLFGVAPELIFCHAVKWSAIRKTIRFLKVCL